MSIARAAEQVARDDRLLALRSEARLSRHLLMALDCGRISLKVAPIPDAKAEIRFRQKRPGARPHGGSIRIDVHQDGAIRLVIHELLHFCFYEELLVWARFEEAIVEALEEALYRWVEGDNRRIDRWRRAIQRNLG